MTEELTEPISMLRAFRRDHTTDDAAVVGYPGLEMDAQAALNKENQLFNEFLDSEAGTVFEEDRAVGLAVGNLVLTGLQLQHATPQNAETFSRRFTEASIELYGAPKPAEVAVLAARKLKKLQALAGNPEVDQARLEPLINFYAGQLGKNAPEVNDEINPELAAAMDEFKSMLEDRYGKIFAIFNEADATDEKIPAAKIAQLFQKGLNFLAEKNGGWRDWTAEVSKARAMSADIKNKKIKVGRLARKADELKAAFGHEVLVHALRSVNGLCNYLARNGLPDYLPAEEAAAKFVQLSLSGQRDPVTSDIYMNIGFALGLLGQPPLNRHQLQKIYLDVLIIEAQAKGEEPDLADLSSKSWTHVYRVYRGSPGNEPIAVNTKDIAYHHKFPEITALITDKLRSGESAAEIFDLLTAAKYDPTNPAHVNYVKNIALTQS